MTGSGSQRGDNDTDKRENNSRNTEDDSCGSRQEKKFGVGSFCEKWPPPQPAKKPRKPRKPSKPSKPSKPLRAGVSVSAGEWRMPNA